MPPNELNATSSPWPFAAWGMDVIGPIEPTTSKGHMFIIVAIDYFIKWVEAASYKAVTKRVAADFIKHRIVCRFRVSESIITDNAANLNSDLMKAIWKKDECSMTWSTLPEQNVQSFQQKGQAKTVCTRTVGAEEDLPILR
ncbi:uncharacterized protein [Nicotiana sylvestris]|uniref:uncharacterized protein n=1 Tax=Nicotiana sylvestris TaxID=4096 RepID=UPI00388CE0A4